MLIPNFMISDFRFPEIKIVKLKGAFAYSSLLSLNKY